MNPKEVVTHVLRNTVPDPGALLCLCGLYLPERVSARTAYLERESERLSWGRTGTRRGGESQQVLHRESQCHRVGEVLEGPC